MPQSPDEIYAKLTAAFGAAEQVSNESLGTVDQLSSLMVQLGFDPEHPVIAGYLGTVFGAFFGACEGYGLSFPECEQLIDLSL